MYWIAHILALCAIAMAMMFVWKDCSDENQNMKIRRTKIY